MRFSTEKLPETASKLALLGLLFLFAVPAFATTVTCVTSPSIIPNGIGPTSLACPALNAGAGFILGNVQFAIAGDYLNGPINTTAGTTVHELYSETGAGSIFGNHTVDINGGFSSATFMVDGSTATVASTVFVGAQTLGAFTVNVNSSVPTGGPVLSSSANAFLTFNATPVPTPEPEPLVLLGAGMIALVSVHRKFRRV